eukprot:Lithocolla_globosa_v1_NODE_4738_length_1377_cov_8.562784.p1 type:complete len:225 gc:universal NODE_4738_length_1377_cov_8.562784:658-1332(+)
MEQGYEAFWSHQAEHMLEATAELICSEWPRSKTLRVRNLSKSVATLPTSLILQQSASGKVVGHVMLSAVSLADSNTNDKGKTALIESVVICKELRGKGLGKLVMKLSHDYLVSQGFTTVYLSTKDRQGFYQVLGYIECEPPVFSKLGTALDSKMQMLMSSPSSSSDDDPAKSNMSEALPLSPSSPSSPAPPLPSAPAPPPPPPPPAVAATEDLTDNCTWFIKQI